EKVYQQLGQFRSLTNKVKQGTQHLRVGAPPVLAAHLLAPTVALLSKEHGISFELSTANRDELCSGLLKHELDVAIAFGEETPPAIMGHMLLKENLALIAPKSAAIPTEKTVTLEELISHDLPIIGLDSRDPLGLLLHQTLSARDEHYQHAITVRSYSAAAELVKNEAGFAIVDPWTAKQYRQDNAVSVHALEPNMSFSVSILFAEHTPQSIATKQFITALKQQMG
ncbi:LysR family transcriptional regulator substrate-binding protein, partial [Vibrio sp. Vb2362]|nr:LysR family transcriptional regulator substrate-binding protein [Vibrio sp. Vb2362]